MKILRYLILTLLMTALSVCLFAQKPADIFRKNAKNQPNIPIKPGPNSTVVQGDSSKKVIITTSDSLLQGEQSFKTKVTYDARDSTIMDATQDIVYLYKDGIVKYDDIELKADFIKILWKKNEVFATGTIDSTGKKVGFPIFTQAGTVYNADTIRFNFKSKKGIIKGLITKQGEGFVQGRNVKKDQNDNMFLTKGHYTTCDLVHPHFYVNMTKFKVANNAKNGTKQVISGPFNLVINDIPLPIGLPFGYFPMPKQQEQGTSGILFPTYGEEPRGRGFYLREGGYYFAINEYVNASVTGQIYSKGGWGLGVTSQYKKLYRYQGNLAIRYNRNTTGDEANPKATPDFQINWTHTPQSHGRSTFSAMVNASTNGYGQRNGFDSQAYLQSALGSSVQYSTIFNNFGRAGVSLRLDQNMATKVLNNSIDYNFGINQFQPLKNKNAITPAWYESFRLALDMNGSVSVTNDLRYSTQNAYSFRVSKEGQTFKQDTVLPVKAENLSTILEGAQMKTRYGVPITLPNFKLFKFINLTPSINYSGEIFTKRQSFEYNPRDSSVIVRNTEGFFNTYNYSFSVSTNTRVYGTFKFKHFGRLAAIRHTFAPSVSFSTSPDFSDPKYGLFQIVKVNTKNDVVYAPRFRGLSSAPGPSGIISFGASNTFEAKLKSKSDTATKAFEKVMLLDNLSFGGSYNLLADSLKLSDITIGTSANIAKKFQVTLGANLNPYKYIAAEGYYTGKKINRFLYEDGKLLSLQSLNFSVSTSFRPPGAKAKLDQKNSKDATKEQVKQIKQNIDQYVDFDIPWSINLSYQYGYTKQGLAEATVISSATFSGDFSLTPKWKFTFRSGYDFATLAIPYTDIGVTRDLHCWGMSFNWIPAAQGARANTYNFEIHAKSTILRDLKLSRRRTFQDRGVFQ